MSRVRILNLPRSCTEDQLRSHLLKSLPPNSPHVEITDCAIVKRSPRTTVHGKGAAQASRPSKASEQGIIRMAFVGFRNAASGHFIVRHFDGTYFGEAKLRVHVARGFADVGLTTNMKKKIEKVQQAQREQQTKISTEEGPAEKRSRDVELVKKEGILQDDEEEGIRKKKRREEFVADRMRAASGPTWAAEVLVPERLEPAEVPRAEGDLALSGSGKSHVQCGEDDSDHDLEGALERQRKLGEVNDMDFLSSLARGSSNKTTGDSNTLDAADTGGAGRGAPAKGDGFGEHQQACMEAVSPRDEQEEIVRESRRVRLGNIPFIATEEDVKQFASSHIGPVEAVHIPLTRDTRQSKGAAFVKFMKTEDAVSALSRCRGAIFMGRLLRVSAATEDPYAKKGEKAIEGLAGSSEFKRQKAQDRHKEAEGQNVVAPMAWNSTYMSSHSAVETVAKRLGVTADAIVSVGARGAAVRAAIVEAYLTSEIREVLGDEGIDFGLLEGARDNLLKARSNTTILVKNVTISDPEDARQLTKMFVRYGTLETTAFPSAGAFALFRYVHQQDARVAFQRLSYKLFKSSPLFLEWAPIGSLSSKEDGAGCGEQADPCGVEGMPGNANEDTDGANGAAAPPVFTLFITNIPFTCTSEDFHTFLLDSCPRLAKEPEKFVERLDFEQAKGRAFLSLREPKTMAYVQQRLNGRNLGGRTLACVVSRQTLSMHNTTSSTLRTCATEATDDDECVEKISSIISRRGAGLGAAAGKVDSSVPPGCDGLKLVVKNVPFEATERDIRELFTAISEVRSVRLPRKSHQFSSHRENNHRGFAFVEFITEEEARRAKQALGSTHLYGRHLVIQYAKLDET